MLFLAIHGRGFGLSVEQYADFGIFGSGYAGIGYGCAVFMHRTL